MNIWKTWTPREDKQLSELLAAGGSWEEIGKKLARSAQATHSRAKKLKLTVRHITWAEVSPHSGGIPLLKPRPADK